MAQSVGELAVVLSATAGPAISELNKFGRAVQATADRAGKAAGGGGGGLFDGVAGAMVKANVVTAAGEAAGRVFARGFSAAAAKETAGLSFEMLTKSAGKGAAVMKDVDALAFRGGLDRQGLRAGAQKLMATGMDPARAVDTLKDLSQIGAATGVNMEGAGRAIGQIVNNGRLMTEEFNQLADADYPVAELARKLGKPMAAIRKEMEAGAISAEQFLAAHKKVAAEFDGALDRKAGTAEGAKNRLSQAVDDVSEAYIPGGVVTAGTNLLARSLGGWAGAIKGVRETVGWAWAGDRAGPVTEVDRAAMRAERQRLMDAGKPTTVREYLDRGGPNPWKDKSLFVGMPDFQALGRNEAAGAAFSTLQDAAGRLMGHVNRFGDSVGGLFGAGAEFRKRLEEQAGAPRSAVGEFRQQNRRIDLAAAAGLSADAAGSARVDAFLKLEAALPKFEARLTAAMDAASQEAESVISRAMTGGGPQSADERVRQVLESSLRQQERIEREIADLKRAILGKPAIAIRGAS